MDIVRTDIFEGCSDEVMATKERLTADEAGEGKGQGRRARVAARR